MSSNVRRSPFSPQLKSAQKKESKTTYRFPEVYFCSPRIHEHHAGVEERGGESEADEGNSSEGCERRRFGVSHDGEQDLVGEHLRVQPSSGIL